jgi:probable phosphoglycerate mutase
MNKPNDYCEIYLVRHGETDWNAEGRLQGHSDIPLNAKGLEQATALRNHLAHIPFAAAFSSDLIRAKKTAEIVLDPREVPLTTTMALRERHAGVFEGRPAIELNQLSAKLLTTIKELSKEEFLSYKWHPDIETSAEVHQRVRRFLETLFPSYLGSPLLIVSHGGVIRSLLDHLSDFIPQQRWIIANCAFIHLKVNGDSLGVENQVGVTRIWKDEIL